MWQRTNLYPIIRFTDFTHMERYLFTVRNCACIPSKWRHRTTWLFFFFWLKIIIKNAYLDCLKNSKRLSEVWTFGGNRKISSKFWIFANHGYGLVCCCCCFCCCFCFYYLSLLSSLFIYSNHLFDQSFFWIFFFSFNFTAVVNLNSIMLVWKNSTNTWFWCMQRIFFLGGWGSILDIFDLLNPNPNDASAYMLSILFCFSVFLVKTTFFTLRRVCKRIYFSFSFFLNS